MQRPPKTVSQLAGDLRSGVTTSRILVREALAKIEACPKAFDAIYADSAFEEAGRADDRRRRGEAISALDGIPLTIKDNMDVEGEVTTAGSRVLRWQPPAATDAALVARIRNGGGIVLAKTYMPELALASIGTSAHRIAPTNVLDTERVPGGSSSGAAVSVGMGVVAAALGTDTGGSVTLPAAVNGLAGYKPTASLLPRDGIVPLSVHLDTAGVIAHSVGCCRLVVEALAGAGANYRSDRRQCPDEPLRLAVPSNYVMEDLDPEVSTAFSRGLRLLEAMGADIQFVEIEELNAIPEIYRGGGFAMPEIAAWLDRRGLLADESVFDPRMLSRIKEGMTLPAMDMLSKIALRQDLVASAAQTLSRWDAVILPTTAILAPRFSEVADDEDYRRLNMRLMRNSRVANILDLCAVSVPLPGAPTGVGIGLLILCPAGQDNKLLDIAESIGLGLSATAG